jgi:hypothetical protein
MTLTQEKSLMRVLGLIRWATLIVAAIAGGAAVAATIEVSFPNYSGGEMNAGFPAAPAIVGQKAPLGLPTGEAVVSGTISGSWGNGDDCCHGTAGVDVFLNGLLVVQCLQSDAACYCPDSAPCVGPAPWSRALTSAQVAALNAGGGATLTAVQTSPRIIRLGATKLTLTTAPVVPPVPTLSPPAFFTLLLGMATIGLIAARRRRAARC